MRHQIPTGDPAAIVARALTLLVTELERKKLAATDRPRPARGADASARYVAAEVRRTVWARDGGRCAFIGSQGRCHETGFLELHHVVPYAMGGQTTAENLELRWAHNQFQARTYLTRAGRPATDRAQSTRFDAGP